MKITAFLFALLTSNLLLADEAMPQPEKGLMHYGIMLALGGLLFYFIMFRPEQKRRKALEDQRTGLKKGDRIVAVGIVGTIAKVEKDTVVVRMYDGSKIEFLKAAISDVTPGNDDEES